MTTISTSLYLFKEYRLQDGVGSKLEKGPSFQSNGENCSLETAISHDRIANSICEEKHREKEVDSSVKQLESKTLWGVVFSHPLNYRERNSLSVN